MNNTLEKLYEILQKNDINLEKDLINLINNDYILNKLKNKEQLNLIINFITNKKEINCKIPNKGYIYIMHNVMFNYHGDNVYKLGGCYNMDNMINGYITDYIFEPTIKYQSKILSNCELAKIILFKYLNKYRIANNREFFNCKLEKIIEKIKYIETLFKDENYQNAVYEYNNLNDNENNEFIEKLRNLIIFNDIEKK